MPRAVVVQSHVEVDIPRGFCVGGAKRLQKDLTALFAEHVEWQGVHVRHVQLVRRLVCSHCGRDWEVDRDYPENCAYCGEIDEKVVGPTGT